VIRRVFEGGAYADQALQSESAGLDARDRALAMRLAYGTVQRRLTLDHLLERFAARPTTQLDPPTLAALRLGLYELLYLSGAPDRAVVADAVELAKAARSAGHGLVNAVLRRAIREGGSALLAELREDTPEQAAVMHSHPEWIARLWWDQLGAETARALMTVDNEPGELALRVNTLRADPGVVADDLGVALHRDPELSEALVLADRRSRRSPIGSPLDLHRSEAWRAGAVLAQSRGAMLVVRALDPQPGERVLDLCAAPGGKSTHIAALMRGEGEVVAVERSPARAAELRETVRRLGAESVRVELGDAALARPEGAVFDRVLVDPPCSGLGTLQSRPDLRWRIAPERVLELSGAQAAILRAGASAVRPGGVLLYSTCTISAAENEQLIEQFLLSDPDFALEDLTNQRHLHSHPSAPCFLLTMPHRERTAGFFVARMRRVATPRAGRL
jgi:16S rRNA (cytosine967-C5)-methyltransferase